MGIDYSLCLITNRQDADSLLANLSTFLDAESRDRIGSQKWSPAAESIRPMVIGTSETDAWGIAGIQLTNYESANSYCFSLHIQLEQEMEVWLPDHCFTKPADFGCMWTSVFAGSKYILLEMTAATSGMSRVIQESSAIHDAWIALAKKTNALFAYIDIEERMGIQLYPHHGDLILPDDEKLTDNGDGHFSVDRLVNFLLATTSS